MGLNELAGHLCSGLVDLLIELIGEVSEACSRRSIKSNSSCCLGAPSFVELCCCHSNIVFTFCFISSTEVMNAP